MRASGLNNDLVVQGYAGSTGVLLACDLQAGVERRDVLGLAIESRRRDAPWTFLPTNLQWDGEPALAVKATVRSDTHPIQKFRWADYGVEPGRTYHYRVRLATGDWRSPSLGNPIELQMRTERFLAGGHEIVFNRAAAASDALGSRFTGARIDKLVRDARRAGAALVIPDEVDDWLSRGLAERITDFIDRATDRSWGLDIAIHEYERDLIVDSVEAALARGVDVRIVYHAREGDPQTHDNERSLRGWPSDRLRPRVTNAVFNQKFIIASRWSDGVRSPTVVLTGSTNFTHNAVYRQANVVHVMRDRAVATKYSRLFDQLFSGSDVDETRQWIDDHNPFDPSTEITVVFSPRSRKRDLGAFAEIVEGAARDVIFVTRFGMYSPLENALLGTADDSIVRFGLINQPNNRITGYHRDRSARFATRALISKGIDGLQRGAVGGQHGDLLLHAKIVVVDFTSDSPTVITGSHNFSAAASGANDENAIVIRGRTDIADCYGLEALRIYDHYHHRASGIERRGHTAPRLTKDGSWTDRYWTDPAAILDRVRFARPA